MLSLDIVKLEVKNETARFPIGFWLNIFIFTFTGDV